MAARLKAGLVNSESVRALIMRAPPVRSFDQDGTSPHTSVRSWRTGSVDGSGSSSVGRGARSRTTGADFVGARFQSGSRPPVRSSTTSNSSASSSAFALAA